MQALRKIDVSMADISAAVAGMERGPQLAGEHAAIVSPALALRDHLSARLEEMTQAGFGGAAALAEPTMKLPMAARVATIVGLSATLWIALGLGVAAVL